MQEPEAVSGRKRHSVGQRFGGSRHVVIYSCPKPYPEAIRRWRPAIVWGDLVAMAFARINLDAVPGSLDKLVRRLLPMRG